MVVKVLIRDSNEDLGLYGNIRPAIKRELPTKRKGWNFNWKSLYEDHALIFKLDYGGEIQGLLKMAKMNDGYYEMAHLEISPSNYGRKGKYDDIAGCLIAYACLLAFELNEGNYQGYLAFTSKSELIEHYEKEYSAEVIYKQKMMINPQNGRKLVMKYLKKVI